jgi:hypothetical protein
LNSFNTTRVVARAGLGVAILATAAVVHLHWVFLAHAGGLWRDEVAITNIATLPSRAAMWRALPHDHCPILFAAVLRAWSGIFGGGDGALRALGFTIGLLLLGSIWLAGRLIWRGAPLLSITLFALNVMVVRYSDSVRAYGLGTACIVLTMILVWRFVQTPTWPFGFGAAAMAILSVQCLYQNAVLVLALCLSGAILFARERRWPRVLSILAIGVPAALSLLPYVPPLLRAQQWWVVSKAGLDVRILSANASALTSYPLLLFRFVWLVVLFAAVVVAVARAFASEPDSDRSVVSDRSPNLSLFAGIALVFGVLGFALFVFVAQLPTEPWYFLVPTGFAIVCCDAILASSFIWARSAVLATAVITLLLAYPSGIRAMKFRQTDGDIVARQLSREASPQDLIIVNPWYCGLTFNRYYRGAAPWTTLSGLDDYGYHRYDLLKGRLALPHPEQPVLDRISATLQSGRRVWIVGWLPAVRLSKDPPPDLPPAPNGPAGWFDEPYNWTWGAQLYYLIATRSLVAVAAPIHSNDPINPFENMGLYVAAGWRKTPALEQSSTH